MRIGLVSSCVPLINGGYRFIVDWLATNLMEAGHQVETVWIPQTDNPATLLEQTFAFERLDLNDHFDRVITFRPPAHFVSHRTKIVWFIHHIRLFYDLWDTEYNTLPRIEYYDAFRKTLIRADTVALKSATKVFSNSTTVKDRLKTYNGVEAEVLYPPVFRPERFHAADYSDRLVFVCRIEHHKRQHLAVEAMKHTRTPVRLHIAGVCSDPQYEQHLREFVDANDLAQKVAFDMRWITEEEKVSLLSTGLASVYLPFDEDSYGYPTIEAALALKCTVTTEDAGGVPEFVEQNISGLICPPDPKALADAFDRLWSDRIHARKMGANAFERLKALNIGWEHVIARLTA